MTLDWHEHPEARSEFLDAHERYLAIEGGTLGDEFADIVEAAVELILEWPEAPPPFGGEILVLAYAHESRRPGYWVHRLNH